MLKVFGLVVYTTMKLVTTPVDIAVTTEQEKVIEDFDRLEESLENT